MSATRSSISSFLDESTKSSWDFIRSPPPPSPLSRFGPEPSTLRRSSSNSAVETAASRRYPKRSKSERIPEKSAPSTITTTTSSAATTTTTTTPATHTAAATTTQLVPETGNHCPAFWTAKLDEASNTDIESSEDDSGVSDTDLSVASIHTLDKSPGAKDCVHRLFAAFADWKTRQHGNTGNRSCNNNSSNNACTLPGSSSDTSVGEPSRGSACTPPGAGSGAGDSPQPTSKKRKLPPSPKRPPRATFACPFWKKDPRRHRACARLTLTRCKDVKQHLARSRAHKPPIYCPCCYDTFATTVLLDAHSRLRSCPLRSPRPPESLNAGGGGLTERQCAALGRRVNRSLDEREQWYAMWDIVFPGVARPTSPYIDASLSEDLAEFREFSLGAAAGDLLSDYLSSHGYQYAEPGAENERTRTIIAGGLDLVYSAWLDAGGGVGTETGVTGITGTDAGTRNASGDGQGAMISPPDSMDTPPENGRQNDTQASSDGSIIVGQDNGTLGAFGGAMASNVDSGQEPIMYQLLEGMPQALSPGVPLGLDSFEDYFEGYNRREFGGG